MEQQDGVERVPDGAKPEEVAARAEDALKRASWILSQLERHWQPPVADRLRLRLQNFFKIFCR